MSRQPLRPSRGAALAEWLVAAPIVMLISLAGLQWALIWQARHALEFAAHEGVRRASTGHGQGDAISQGLAAGLQAFWLMPEPVLAQVRLQTGLAAGWVSWKRLRPDQQVFADFAQPARTPGGDVIPGEQELPNDNLRYRSAAAGATSGVSIQDANRFRLELTYGIPLRVPLIGALIARSMEIFDGCAAPVFLHLSLTQLGKPTVGESRPGNCPVYRAPEYAGGPAIWRLPTRVRAQGWMHSPLRASAPIDSRSYLKLKTK